MRRGGLDPFSVEPEVPVIANPHFIATKRDQPLDVELVLRKPVNSSGLENDDFAQGRFSEIVCNAIDEEMVAADDLQLNDVFALFELARKHARAVGEVGTPKHAIGRKPDCVGVVADHEALAQIEEQEFLRSIVDHAQDPVGFSDLVRVADASEPKDKKPADGIWD